MQTGTNRYGIPTYEIQKPSDIDPWDAEQAVRSALPSMDQQWKTDYLGYRATGFSITEARILAGVSSKTVKKARRTDEFFQFWETAGLLRLQAKVGEVVVRFQFMRNFHLTMKIDGDMLYKQAMEPAKITDKEHEWAKDAAKRYKIQDYALMLKALEPEKHTEGGTTVNVTVNVEGQDVVNEDAQRAAARRLLDQFTINSKAAHAVIDTVGTPIEDEDDE